MKNKYKITLLIIISIFISCGCWDRIEIEDRAFVLGIGLDKGDKSGEIALTYQIALPSAMYGENGGSGPQVINLTTTSSSVLKASQQLFMMLDKVIDLEHVRVLVISEELSKGGIKEYIDYFLREIDMRRRVEVLVSRKKASELLEVSPPTANSSSDFLADIITQNEKRSARISSKVDLLQITRDLRTGNDFMLAGVMIGDDKDLKMSGAAIFKGDELVANMPHEEVRMAKWLKNDISKGIILFEDIKEAGGHIVFSINEEKTEVKPKIKGNNVNFHTSIRVEGDIGEIENLEFNQTLTLDFLDKFERIIEEKIKSECMEIFYKAQNEYEAEIFDF